MPTRSYTTPSALDLFEVADQDSGATRETSVTIDVLDGPFAMFAALQVPAQRLGIIPQDGSEQGWLLASDGSWACQTVTANGAPTVTQAGPKLWDMLESTHAEWGRLDQPPREAFGLTVADGRQFLWLDSPESGHVWRI
jgi:hypothetical protein